MHIIINWWSRNCTAYTHAHTTGKHCIEIVSSCTNELKIYRYRKMQVQTRLTIGEGVAVLNNCYAPLTKIPEKYKRAMTLHRDNRGEICGQRSRTWTIDGPWEIREEGIGISGQSPTRLHTHTPQKSCMESVESYCPYGKLWTSIYCEGRRLPPADITSATADHATVTEMKHIGSKFCDAIVTIEFISPTVACRPVMLQA